MKYIIIFFFIFIVSVRHVWGQDGNPVKSPSCSSAPFYDNGREFYQICYCEELAYPQDEKAANNLGLTLIPKAVVTSTRKPEYGGCGVELRWIQKPSTKKECDARIAKFEDSADVPIDAGWASLSCQKLDK